MNDDIRAQLDRYVSTARDFIEGRLAGPSFQERFLNDFKKDQRLYADSISEYLMMMFDEAECYEPDPKLLRRLKQRDPKIYLNEDELRERARGFVQKMQPILARR